MKTSVTEEMKFRQRVVTYTNNMASRSLGCKTPNEMVKCTCKRRHKHTSNKMSVEVRFAFRLDQNFLCL